ncbi:MAG: saccharopine dehydrogenase C-terminal domain-containing protein [Thermoanaerobaculia bacterium]
MKILVFGGSGRIGRAVAWDLIADPEVTEVALVGNQPGALAEARSWLASSKVTPHLVDVDDRDAVLKLIEGYDAGVLTLPDRRASYRMVEQAIEGGLSVVDVLEEYHRRPDIYEIEGLRLPEGMSLDDFGDRLHRDAMANGVTVLDGMGLAPGLTNITVGEAMRELDHAEEAVARVGGIPDKAAAAHHPLRYMITWSFEHVLREYMIRVNIKKDGEVVEVEAGADRESFRFQALGHDEVLECAVTPGMPSFLHTRPELKSFAEKTVRWPGHWGGVETLKECGLLGLDPVQVNGSSVVPRHFLASLITPRLRPQPGETDVCVMYNTVSGSKDGKAVTIEHFMWEKGDPQLGLSAMMRTTSIPAAIAVRFLASRKVQGTGIVAPEDGIVGAAYHEFVAELAKRNITIHQATRVESDLA